MLWYQSAGDNNRVGVGGIHLIPLGHPGFGFCCAKLAESKIQFACAMGKEDAVRMYSQLKWADEFPNEIRESQQISVNEPYKHLTSAMLHLLKRRLNGTCVQPNFPHHEENQLDFDNFDMSNYGKMLRIERIKKEMVLSLIHN